MSYVSFGRSSGGDKEIKVVLKDGTWMTTHFVDGEPDRHVIKMFGTNELPTPWSSDTDRDTVIEELASRNAHAKIG